MCLFFNFGYGHNITVILRLEKKKDLCDFHFYICVFTILYWIRLIR